MDRHSSDRESFEKYWRKAVDQAEITPSDRVWSMISKSLDVFKYRHRSQLYGLVAAVAVLIAVSISVQSEWIGSEPHLGNIYLSKKSYKDELKGQQAIELELSMGPHAELNKNVSLDFSKFYSNSEHVNQKKMSHSIAIDRKIINPDKKDYQFLDNTSTVKTTIKSVPSFYPKLFRENSIKGKAPHSWAGLNIGGSSFNPNYEMTNVGDLLVGGGLNPGLIEDQEGTITSLNENMMVGINRKIELNLGMTIKERFVLEGGLQYVQTELVQQSNFMIENISYPISMSAPNLSLIAESKGKSVEKMQKTSYTATETELENRIDFASVPLRAGFIFLDQRLSLRLNAGLVTNFYLGNIHRSLDDQTPLAEFRSSDNSLYKNVSFSGQTGVSLGYRLLQNIDVTFEPNYTQSFQSITRSYMGFSSVPNGFGIMAGVRYNFN